MKRLLFVYAVVGLLLTACGGSKMAEVDILDYVEVEFEGVDSVGTASYDVNVNSIIKDILKIDSKKEIEARLEDFSEEDREKFIIFLDSDNKMDITFSESENLSNGDEVELTVKVIEGEGFIKGGQKKFTVENLEEVKVLTSEEVEKFVVVDFLGANGKGFVSIKNLFKDNLANLTFEVENDGELTNGDKVELKIAGEEEENDGGKKLIDLGYKLEENFKVEKEVKNLPEYASSAKDIKNYKAINRMLDERAKEAFDDSNHSFTKCLTFYRQFDDQVELKENLRGDVFAGIGKHGKLISLYEVTEYIWPDEKTKDNMRDKKFKVMGYSNLQVDKDNKVDVSKIKKIGGKYTSESFEMSEESLKQIFEADGYELVK